jgi:RNA polymerase sigma-70 factor (ECF subfamily)
MSNNKKKKFMVLYQPVHERFERFCKARAYGQMDFKDLMQETVVIAFEKLDEIKNTDAFLYFLFGTSTRILSNANRKIKEEEWEDSFENRASLEPNAQKKLEVEDLYKALGRLPDLQREGLILFEISGFSIKEIAAIQDSSEDAVKKRLSRGRQELTKLLTGATYLIKN